MVEAGTARQRLGVFGSAFNPPQNAHLTVVDAAVAQLGLDRLIAVPTGHPYHKEPEADPGPEVRLRMAQAAFRDRAEVSVSPSEVEREGPSYTYVTLEQIEADNPDSEIHLLMGADTARDFGGWKRPERILELARIAVAQAGGAPERGPGGIRCDRGFGAGRLPRHGTGGPFFEPRPEADRGRGAGGRHGPRGGGANHRQ